MDPVEVGANVSASDFWLGGDRLIDPDEWTWTDASDWNYSNWAPGLCVSLRESSGEPSTNDRLNCAVMDVSTQKWKTALCQETRPFLCLGDATGSFGSSSLSVFSLEVLRVTTAGPSSLPQEDRKTAIAIWEAFVSSIAGHSECL